MDGRHRLAGEPFRGDLHHVDLRMAGEQTEHLATGVPGAPDDSRADHPAPKATSSTDTARSNSAMEMCSRGVWSSCESPGPYATA